MNFTCPTRPLGCPRVLANGLRGVLAVTFISTAISASATDYFVSTTGNDANTGTQASPFRTISKGVSVAQAGDGVIIRSGTYRESVVVPRSGTSAAPIRIEAFSGETPVINGCDVVTPWTSSGGKYSTTVGWDLGAGKNQMFVDGKALEEGRLMDAGNDIIRAPRFILQSASYSASGTGSLVKINSADLTNSTDALVGSRILVNDGLYGLGIGGVVVANAPGTVSFKTDYPIPYVFQAGNQFTLFGLSWFADKPNEWSRSGNTVQFIPNFSDSIASHTVEVKKRPIGIDLSGRNYVNVTGLRLFGCRIKTTDSSGYITISNLWAKYVGHNVALSNPWSDPEPGIELRGSFNTITNSVIEYCSGSGVTINGTSNNVRKVQIHDVNYGMSNIGGVEAAGSKHRIEWCSIYNCGRAGIYHSNTSNISILNNDIFQFCTLTTDCGGTYTWQSNGGDGCIAYNTIHDGHNDGPGIAGVMLDNGTSNYRVHHNVVWNTDHGVHITPPNKVVSTMPNLRIVANTFDCTRTGLWIDTLNTILGGNVSAVRDYPGLVVANLASVTGEAVPADTVLQGDGSPTPTSSFVSPLARDYRLSATSGLIDAAASVAPAHFWINGARQDIGALEYGQAMFGTGADPGFGPVVAPLDLRASSGLGRVALSWLRRAGATGYNVYRSDAGEGNFTLLAANVPGTSYDDFSATPNQNYDYILTAVNGDGESGFSTPSTGKAYAQIELHGLIGEYSVAILPNDSYAGLLFGPPTFRRLDANVDFEWQLGSPDPSIPNDNFAIVWTGFVKAPTTGTYTFTSDFDNGTRVVVNNQPIIDKMTGKGVYSGTINLQAGQSYPIRIEYSTPTGWTKAHLYWTVPGQTSTIIPTSAFSPSEGGGVEAAYYNDTPLTFGLFSSLAGVTMDSMNGAFSGSPLSGVNAAFWSCHQRGQIMAPIDGPYAFQMASNSALKVILNGQTIVSKWNDTSTNATATVNLKAGTFYDVQYDYAQGVQGSTAYSFKWSFAGQTTESVPLKYLFPPLVSDVNGIGAQFYSDGNFGNPVASKSYGNVDVDWSSGSPASGVPATGYSVRWSGRIAVQASQSRAFKVDTIGKVKLTINGKVLIDNTNPIAWSQQSKFIMFTAGTKYDVLIEYAPGANKGKLSLSWVPLGPFSPTVVPKSNLFMNYRLDP